MCGIWGLIDLNSTYDLSKLLQAFMKIQYRGPDRSDFKIINEFIKIYLGYHRLAIMDRSTYGDQPFTYEIRDKTHYNSVYAICNGEIYNFKDHIEKNNFIVKSSSDCEILPQMYAKYGFVDMLRQLRGEFAMCVLDIDHLHDVIKVHIGRDQMGVRPIFIGVDDNGIGFSSTLSGIVDIIKNKKMIRQVKRAESISITVTKDKGFDIETKRYHDLECPIKQYMSDKTNGLENILNLIRSCFIDSVICRLESDRPIGALLSGGLDSSLVVAIASSYLNQFGKRLRTFSIGLPNSTDKKYAEIVARHCDTDHTHIEFTQDQFLRALPDIIKITETFDITTIRASTGQYLLSKWIKENTDIKVLLIGDGSDELCAGYMYFHNAPSAKEMHQENIRLLEDIQYYDVLRADRCIASNGLEARVPFLDHNFVALYLSIDPELRLPRQESDLNGQNRRIEKWLLRKSFDCVNSVGMLWLPDVILWRKKEAFSDGVSPKEKSWYILIQEYVENIYADKHIISGDDEYHIRPPTKEALYFRKLFNTYFSPHVATVIPYYWMPKWSGLMSDPSARTLKVYDQ